MMIPRSVHFAADGITSFFSRLSNIPLGFPGGSVIKNPTANAGDTSSMPGLGRSYGELIGNLL